MTKTWLHTVLRARALLVPPTVLLVAGCGTPRRLVYDSGSLPQMTGKDVFLVEKGVPIMAKVRAPEQLKTVNQDYAIVDATGLPLGDAHSGLVPLKQILSDAFALVGRQNVTVPKPSEIPKFYIDVGSKKTLLTTKGNTATFTTELAARFTDDNHHVIFERKLSRQASSPFDHARVPASVTDGCVDLARSFYRELAGDPTATGRIRRELMAKGAGTVAVIEWDVRLEDSSGNHVAGLSASAKREEELREVARLMCRRLSEDLAAYPDPRLAVLPFGITVSKGDEHRKLGEILRGLLVSELGASQACRVLPAGTAASGPDDLVLRGDVKVVVN